MAVHISSNTQSEQEMREVLDMFGLSPDTPEPEPIPDAKGEKPEPKVKAGESTPPEPSGESAPDSEPGKKPQEKLATQEPGEAPEGEAPKKFEPREHRKLQRRIERLVDDLEASSGKNATLERELAALKEQLVALTPPPDTAKPAELVKPKRPTRAECEYDDDKYEQQMAEYDDKLAEYHAAVNRKSIDEALANAQETRRKEDEDKAVANALADLNRRTVADTQEYGLTEEYNSMVEQLPEEPIKIGDAAEAYMMGKSKHPGLLIHYFMSDYLNGDGVECERFRNLDVIDQSIEIRELEQRLLAAHKKPAAEAEPETKPKPAAAAPPPEKPEPPPAKPKPAAKPPAEPIEPVGSRASVGTAGLDKATSFQEYVRRRGQGANR
jgi:hypothetical protein